KDAPPDAGRGYDTRAEVAIVPTVLPIVGVVFLVVAAHVALSAVIPRGKRRQLPAPAGENRTGAAATAATESWHVKCAGETHGPLSTRRLRRALRIGAVPASCLVWLTGTPGWRTADAAGLANGRAFWPTASVWSTAHAAVLYGCYRSVGPLLLLL